MVNKTLPSAFATETYFCEAFKRYASLTDTIDEILESWYQEGDVHNLTFKTCIGEITSRIEEDGAQKFIKGLEPKYHNREHTKEVCISLFLLLNVEEHQRITWSQIEQIQWPQFNLHEKFLLLIAGLAHDFLHTGNVNQKDAELEMRSVEAIRETVLKYLTVSDMNIISTLILATEFKKVQAIHFSIQKNHDNKPISFIERAKIILTEADVCASALPLYGEVLAKKLAEEWKRAGLKNSEQLILKSGRRDFLKQVSFSSPHAKSLGLNKLVEEQLLYLDKELI